MTVPRPALARISASAGGQIVPFATVGGVFTDALVEHDEGEGNATVCYSRDPARFRTMQDFDLDPLQPQPAAAATTTSSPATRTDPSRPPRNQSGIDWHSKISTSTFIQIARRAAMSLKAGIDMRRVWEIEVTRNSGKTREVLAEISRQINSGNSFAEAVRDSHYFPPLVVELTRVGEQTGKLDEVLSQLAEHYEQLQKLFRNFLLGIAWPMFELGMALLVIALVIWAPTALTGQEIDILGIGLTGTSGVLWYFAIVATVLAVIASCIYALVRGWFGPAPVAMARRLPFVGRCLECLALARCSWVLALAHESGMSARQTARLALGASHHPLFRSQAKQIDTALAQGRPFHDAFAETLVFPNDFLDALHAAEISGTITETMHQKTKDYEQESTTLLTRLAVVAGLGVFLMVMGFMVLLIFKLALNYINQLNSIIDNPMGNL